MLVTAISFIIARMFIMNLQFACRFNDMFVKRYVFNFQKGPLLQTVRPTGNLHVSTVRYIPARIICSTSRI